MAEKPEAYMGQELELFRHAQHWKAYWQSTLAQYIAGKVLEVGGGIGANTSFFEHHSDQLVVLEPDPAQAQIIMQRFPGKTQVLSKTVREINDSFDAIFYIDVLEHIEDDRGELAAAFQNLRTGGIVAVLAPAYSFLFSPFDQSVGHYRRYTQSSLIALKPPQATIKTAFYLDSVGSIASLVNKLFLKQSTPTLSQIRFWDRVLVPLSRLFDPLLCNTFGKTIVVIFEKTS